MVLRFALVLLLLCSFRLNSTAETDHESESDIDLIGASTESGGCVVTEQMLVAAVNASNNGALIEAVVNCFAYQDRNKALYNAIVSGVDVDSNGVRYIVTCVNELLLLTVSMEPSSNVTAYCAQCQDNDTNFCVTGKECSPDCTACFGVTDDECLACETARFNNTCVPECPGERMTPNSDNGNECECPNYFTGENCQDCDLVCDGENGYYFLDPTSCLCVEECNSVIELLDYMATVPQSVIGSPTSEGCVEAEGTGGAERKRNTRRKNIRTGESTHGEAEFTPEPGICVSTCSLPLYRADSGTDNVCYACGHNYCLECNSTGFCFQCRDGTLPGADEPCLGFYAYIEELTCELEEEELHEMEIFAEEQMHLFIYVPIACVLTIIFFVSMAVIAHFRYPHHGEKKRHRKPREEIPAFEKSFRPQATAKYR